jgi:DNA-binding HxlR family transcriptional regulator
MGERRSWAGARHGSQAEALPPTRTEGEVASRDLRAPNQAMGFEEILEPCRGIEILKRVGDKWSVYVIHMLGVHGTLRFGELLRRIDGISQRMLSVTLRGLERDGLVRRTMFPEVPPRVEYTLTPLGRTLRSVVGGLIAWSVEHLPEIETARTQYDQREPGWGVDDI